MILDALHKLANHRTSLTREEARDVMAQILRGEATDAQIGALLVALHMKGETVEEIVGFAQAIRAEATPLNPTTARRSTLAAPGATRWSTPAAPAAIPAAPSTSRPRPP
jgi:anthranilate phosphoribosyltransferase